MSRNKPVTKLAVLDIETLDKKPGAIIFAIGCVIVDVDNLEIVNEFYTIANPDQKGRTAGNGTPEWWIKQSAESPDAFEQLKAAYGTNKTLKAALYELGSFLNDEFNGEPANVFGNGPEFDNVIVDDAFAWAGLKTPWPYWGNQSIRTSNLLMQIAGVKSEREFVGIKHHALDDAYHEAFLLIDALKCFKPVEPSIPKNPVYVAPTKQSAEEWANHHVEFKNHSDAINTALTGEGFKAAATSAELAVKKLTAALSKVKAGEFKAPKVKGVVPYIDAWYSIVDILDGVSDNWRKNGQDIHHSAVDKIKHMATAIEMCDLERVSGEYQAASRYMTAIKSKLRGHGYEPNSFMQVASCIDNALFENQSLKERAHCFDELQKVIRAINEDSFERECASSLLDDCKHAINVLSGYKSKYYTLKIKHQHCD